MNDRRFAKGWMSPQDSRDGASVISENATINKGASESCYPVGWGSSSRQDTAVTYASPSREGPNGHFSRVESPDTGLQATPPPIARSRRYIVDDFEERVPSPDSFVQRPSIALQKNYITDQMEEDASSRSSTERPLTVLRAENYASPRVMSPYKHTNRQEAVRESRSPLSVEDVKQGRTPALDKILDYESSKKFQSRGKAPNSPIHEETSAQLDTGQTRNEHDLFTRKNGNDSGVGISDRSRSSRERGASSGQGDSVISQRSSKLVENANRPVDFFSQAIFQVVMHNPATSHQLLNYCRSQHCANNVDFLTKVCQVIL